MKKILCIDNFEPPYRVPFFNILGAHYDVTLALSERKNEQKGRNEKWFVEQDRNYKLIQLPGKKIFGKKICFSVRELIRDDSYDLYFMDMYGNLTNMLAILLINMKKKNKKFILSVDGMLERKENKLVKMLKSYLLKSPCCVLSPSDYVTRCLMSYGVDSDKIYQYPFSSIVDADVEERCLTKDEKRALRQKLGIKEEKVIVTVGQCIPRKGFDVLLNACAQIDGNVGVYFLGGEKTQEYDEIISKNNLKNIVFPGFKSKEELREYYKAADLFVLPTREDIWGLVVNEAMACGLPVITTDRCVAGLELVKDDENGYIVPVDEVDLLATHCNTIIHDEKIQQSMAECSLEKIREFTVENMASRHIEVFDEKMTR